MSDDGAEGSLPSFADRLNTLFTTIKPEGQTREYSNAELARAVGVSDVYISQLRRGQRTNPSHELITKIEQFFGLTEPYLSTTDQATVENVDRDLSTFRVLRANGLLPLARRVAEIRSPEGQAHLATTIELILRGEAQSEPRSAHEPDLNP